MKIKQPAWEFMPVLDVRHTSDEQIQTLAAAYDRLANENLDALSRLDGDSVRRQIDAALSEVLGLPDLGPIRELLAREPGLTAHDIGSRPTQQSLDLAEYRDEEEGD